MAKSQSTKQPVPAKPRVSEQAATCARAPQIEALLDCGGDRRRGVVAVRAAGKPISRKRFEAMRIKARGNRPTEEGGRHA